MRLLMTSYDCAMREDLLRSVCQEDTSQTSTGQPYTTTQIIKPVKQEEDPNKTSVTPAAPTEVEGPPSSCLRSKTKQQSTTIKQEQLECHPVLLDWLERNQPKVEVNQVEMDMGNKSSLVHYALTLLGVAKTISEQLWIVTLKKNWQNHKNTKNKNDVYTVCRKSIEIKPFFY